MAYVLCGLVGLSALIQGGFYPGNFLTAGVVLAGLSIWRKRGRILPEELALWGFCAVYLLASLAGGYSLESLSQAALPLVAALFLGLFCALVPRDKTAFFRWLLLGSGVVAGLAILSYCGLVPLTGAVTARRLQFPFQYANAAGSWFAAVTLANALADDPLVRKLRLPCLCCLFLTRSVGALGLYLLAQLWLLHRSGFRAHWRAELLAHVLAGAFAFGFWACSGLPALPLLAMLYLASIFFDSFLAPRLCKAQLHWVFLVLGVGGAVAFCLSGRFSASLGTFAERIVMILDSGRIAAAHPLLGIGAGNWKAVYAYYQSAQYTSAAVHSGLAQMAVDAGVPAVLLFLVFLALALRRGGRRPEASAAAALLVLHSLVDFTLQFFPIFALLTALLCSGDLSEAGLPVKPLLRRAGAALCALLCAALLYGQLREKQLLRAAGAGDYRTLAAAWEAQRPLFGAGPDARDLYLRALYVCGETETLLAETADDALPTTDALLLRAAALRASGAQDEAERLLLWGLERQLFHVDLFRESAALLEEWGADASCVDAYNALARRANESVTSLGRLKGDQVPIDYIE